MLLLCGGWAAQVSPSHFLFIRPFVVTGSGKQYHHGNVMNSRASGGAMVFCQGWAVKLATA
ncbi:hypothetical protein [Acidovorax sp. JHL-9]|uniref:hypothetical protein n=1 Tax=Acidovorax sp. JHL-9 TaxID=1276756 RepID=UPI00041BB070|nr:hypothetical protein [Acidovorax sp. JHL-9]